MKILEKAAIFFIGTYQSGIYNWYKTFMVCVIVEISYELSARSSSSCETGFRHLLRTRSRKIAFSIRRGKGQLQPREARFRGICHPLVTGLILMGGSGCTKQNAKHRKASKAIEKQLKDFSIVCQNLVVWICSALLSEKKAEVNMCKDI